MQNIIFSYLFHYFVTTLLQLCQPISYYDFSFHPFYFRFAVSLIRITILLHSRCQDNSVYGTTVYGLDGVFHLHQRETILFFAASVLTQTPKRRLMNGSRSIIYRVLSSTSVNWSLNHFYIFKISWGYQSTPPNDFLLYGETKYTQCNMSLLSLFLL
jgi:hypothetical protein